MNSNIGISIGWIDSCGTMRGRDSSTLKVLVSGQNKYILLGYWVVFFQDALEVSALNTVCEI